MKKTPIIFITCLLFLLPLEATESKQYAFQQIINTQNGLSSSVRCLTVSHEKGYVWIGTRSGIGRFDGYELKKFLHDIWGIERSGFFNGREKWAKGFENQRV